MLFAKPFFPRIPQVTLVVTIGNGLAHHFLELKSKLVLRAHFLLEVVWIRYETQVRKTHLGLFLCYTPLQMKVLVQFIYPQCLWRIVCSHKMTGNLPKATLETSSHRSIYVRSVLSEESISKKVRELVSLP